MDNLNTHTPASFYEVFPPEQAKALINRLEIHYTPKHASWLNIAEIELSVLARQGLAHNIATVEDLCQQVQSWQNHRNQRVGTVNWLFRTADARIKLKRLYPVQQPGAQPPGHEALLAEHLCPVVIALLLIQPRNSRECLCPHRCCNPSSFES